VIGHGDFDERKVLLYAKEAILRRLFEFTDTSYRGGDAAEREKEYLALKKDLTLVEFELRGIEKDEK
jgi:hypothetical protein